jgi:hypothetical protein
VLREPEIEPTLMDAEKGDAGVASVVVVGSPPPAEFIARSCTE